MLAELTIRDYVLVRELHLELASGMTAMTGETGAGKSLLVGALKLLLGDRANPTTVRVGARSAYIEACFRFASSNVPSSLAELILADGAPEPNEETAAELIVAREVFAAGGSRAWIQGRRAPVARLREVVTALMDLHGQHAHQSLLRVENHRDLVDAVGGLERARAAVAAAHHEALTATRAVDARREELQALAERRDLYEFQAAELRSANLEAGEEEELERTALRLSHAEAVAGAALLGTQLLTDGEPAASDLLARARAEIEKARRYAPGLMEADEFLAQAQSAIDEACRALVPFAEPGDDPARLEEIQNRLALLAELKRKYRVDHAGLIALQEKVTTALRTLEDAGGEISVLEQQATAALGALSAAAAELTRRRRKVAARLAAAVQEELAHLGMEGARFEIAIEPREPSAGLPAGPDGADRVEFRVAPNVGERAGPLAKVGSGGELSRLMLAIKSLIAEADPVPLLVFDEIDSGVGGRSALKVADRLAALARSHQVLVVTHLASIAAAANQQLQVAKKIENGRTVTHVVPVAADERVREIARMLAGDGTTDSALEHARDLLRSAATRGARQ